MPIARLHSDTDNDVDASTAMITFVIFPVGNAFVVR